MQCGMRIGPGTLVAGAVSLGFLASSLSQPTQRMVVDRTALTGPWDVTLTYTPEPSQIARGALAPGDQPTVNPDGPSIFTAVQEQLGLKLDSQRGPVEVLVIDRAEKPVEN